MSSVPLNVSQTITIRVEGKEYSVSRGTRVKAFLRRYLPDREPDCFGALANRRLLDLETPIAASCELVPLTFRHKEGQRIYRASLTLVFIEAVERLFPGARVQVGQSLGDGYFFDILKDTPITVAEIASIEAEMRAMVGRNEPLAVMRMPAPAAIEVFEGLGRKETADLIRVKRRNWVALVTMGRYIDLWHQPLLPTAEMLKMFRLDAYEDGVVLSMPPAGRVDDIPDSPCNHKGLFAAYRETRGWNRRVGVERLADLNRAIIDGSIGEVIRVSEALHERKIASIADDVQARTGCRLVLVAGPSSSGKTTFVKRLRMQLLAIGVRPKEISVDNYYVDRVKTPRDESGDYDFECIEAIDLELLNDHLVKLLAGEEIGTPRYSFTKGAREEKTTPVRLAADEVLLIEGIHGLNPLLTQAVPDDRKTRIYVSALTQLCLDDHNRVFTSDARLLRRIVRDRHFRGYSASETIRMWPKVRRGEEKWIFPFQDRADRMFNSTLIYEAALLKVFAERFLMEVPDSDPATTEAIRLLSMLDLVVPLFADDVPATSILREFIGGSAFDY